MIDDRIEPAAGWMKARNHDEDVLTHVDPDETNGDKNVRGW